MNDAELIVATINDLRRRVADLERAAGRLNEGTWTPTLSVGSFGNSTVAARWRRNGMWCSFSITIGFGSTFNGGSVTAWTLSAPFPAAYQQAIADKLFIPSVGHDLPGIGYISGSTLTPLVALSSTTSRVGTIINADVTAAAGTGSPSGIGSNYPMANGGNIVLFGTYRVADGY